VVPMRASYLLLVALGLILTGFALVLAGTVTSGSAAGCFFWPFPVIIVCGAGTGAAPYSAVVVGAIALVAVSVFSFLWMRKGAGGSASPSETAA
jgi:flagellar motor component MotA